MGTRGFVGFVADGREIITYNHFDSYPSGLGLQVLRYLRECALAGSDGHDWHGSENTRPSLKAIRQRVTELVLVSEDFEPTEDEIAELKRWGWRKSEHGGEEDYRPGQKWYDLLHETQGDVGAILACGFAVDSSSFPLDSLFCEWGYLIDLDGDGRLEVYRGFQKGSVTGRWAGQDGEDGYSPVTRIASYPLASGRTPEGAPATSLPSDEQFKADTDPQE